MINAIQLLSKEHPMRVIIMLSTLLAAIIVAIYWPLTTHAFLNYDDPYFVYANPHVNSGVSMANFKWAFSTLHGGTSYWHPLTWLSLQLDSQLFGMRSGDFLLTNLWLHISNSILLLLGLNRLTHCVWRSAMVSALFAVHPLHVETVAWVSERKGLLCAFFWLLAIIAYGSYVKAPSPCKYIVVLLLCCASLMSKPFAVSLPVILLLLDFWPLGRFKSGRNTHDPEISSSGEQRPQRRLFCQYSCWILIIEKLPMFAAAALASWLTVTAQIQLSAMPSLGAVPLDLRFCNAVVSYTAYIRKMILPFDIAVIYPLFGNVCIWKVAGAFVALFSVTAFAIRVSAKAPYVVFGWLWYVISLIPVIGVVQAGAQSMADRYTYLSFIGLFITVAWGIAQIGDNAPSSRSILALVVVTIVASLAVISIVVVRNWKNSTQLFEYALSSVKVNYIAHYNLGLALRQTGNCAEAEYHFMKALQIKPDMDLSRVNLAGLLFLKGDTEASIYQYQEALRLKEERADTYADLANVFENTQDPRFHDLSRAAQYARRACELTNYKRADFILLLGGIFAGGHDYGKAITLGQLALTLSDSREEREEIKAFVEKLSHLKAAE